MMASMLKYLTLPGLLGYTFGTLSITKVPPIAQDGPSTAVFKSSPGFALDGPKLDHVNATSFEWWYFDAVAADGKTQVGFLFYNTETSSLGFAENIGTVNSVLCTAYFPNGTKYEQMIPATVATIATKGDGASGVWAGTGASFTGAPDLKTYVVTVDAPQHALKGKIEISSIAPAYFPCAPNKPRQSEQMLKNIGWAVAVPDSRAMVDFTIGDDRLKFSGYGYHDKNWGIDTLPNSVSNWYWGHAHLGPYSLVFLDAVDKDGIESASGYLVKNGKVVGLGCAGLRVRPKGSDFPPTVDSPVPTSLHLEYTTDDGVFTVEFSGAIIWQPPLNHEGWGYNRWAGAISGGFKGKTTYSGAAVWEWMHYLD